MSQEQMKNLDIYLRIKGDQFFRKGANIAAQIDFSWQLLQFEG